MGQSPSRRVTYARQGDGVAVRSLFNTHLHVSCAIYYLQMTDDVLEDLIRNAEGLGNRCFLGADSLAARPVCSCPSTSAFPSCV